MLIPKRAVKFDDESTSGISPERKRKVRRFATLVAAAADIGVSQEDMRAIKAILDPHLRSVADLLSVSNEGRLR